MEDSGLFIEIYERHHSKTDPTSFVYSLAGYASLPLGSPSKLDVMFSEVYQGIVRLVERPIEQTAKMNITLPVKSTNDDNPVIELSLFVNRDIAVIFLNFLLV